MASSFRSWATRGGLSLCHWLVMAPALAAAPAPTLSDCDGPHQTVLAAEPPMSAAFVAAKAVWLDGRTLRWPGLAAEGRFRLLHSRSSGLSLAAGEVPGGVEASIALSPARAPLPPVVAERFRHVATGVTLEVAASDLPSLRELLRGQLVLVREDEQGRLLEASHTQLPGAVDDAYAAAERLTDLGARPGRDRTSFRLWAPTAQAVSVCLFDDGRTAARALLPMQRDAATGSWRAVQRGRLAHRAYTYVVDVHVPGVGLVRNLVTDPYSLSLTADSRRSGVLDLRDPALAPPGWHRTPRPDRVLAATDMVIHELHVRDHSIGDATVPAAHRGKYLAFTDLASNGMRHLRALAQAGLTDVHLLPVFDIASVPESGCVTPSPAGPPDGEEQQAAVEAVKAVDCFNWGYDPLHFTAPEGSYASDSHDPRVRIVEFRRMVQALHRLGLRVGMDVVYNHMSASGQDPKSVLDRIVPGYYHRLNAAGQVETSTCCANTATEHRMMAKLMIDSAVVWARDHRIDSFRFDLMAHQPRAVMEQLQRRVNTAAGRHIHLIGEGWNFGEVANGSRFVQASQLSLNGSGIATFSDRARDAVRGGSAGDNGVDQVRRQGYINGQFYDPNALAQATEEDLQRSADLVRVGLAGSLRGFMMKTWRDEVLPLERIDYAGQPAGYVSQPGEVVNYVENHDNQTLFDLNTFKLPAGTSREDRARVQILGAAINAFSQGIAYFHAGIESLRSKSMDRNSYDSGDWFNRLDWSFQDNFFGTGLPPRRDNGDSWPWMKPLLAKPAIKPTATEIGWTRDAFFDLLRIRASSTLFRLRTADEVRARLVFPNTGSGQVPTVLVGRLRGDGLRGADFGELIYFVNVDTREQSIEIDAARGRAFELHPVHRSPASADRRPVERARFDAEAGRFTLPPRTALVYVRR